MSGAKRGTGEDAPALPGDLRFLKWLTGLLAGVMIVGLVVIVGLLVTRLRPMAPPAAAPAALPTLPAALDLPEGMVPEAVTFGQGWIAVVAGQEILIFSPDGGAPRQRLRLLLE